MHIALIGGGHAARTILHTLARNAAYQVVLVVDRNQDAVGMQTARAAGIATATDMDAAFDEDIALLIDATGVAAVGEKIRAGMREGQILVPTGGARLLVDVVARHDRDLRELADRLLERLRTTMNTAFAPLDNMRDQIHRVLDEANILATNGRIQAAKAGVHGRGFVVVVEGIGEVVQRVQQALDGMDRSVEARDQVLAVIDETVRAFAEEAGGVDGAADPS